MHKKTVHFRIVLGMPVKKSEFNYSRGSFGNLDSGRYAECPTRLSLDAKQDSHVHLVLMLG